MSDIYIAKIAAADSQEKGGKLNKDQQEKCWQTRYCRVGVTSQHRGKAGAGWSYSQKVRQATLARKRQNIACMNRWTSSLIQRQENHVCLI